MRLKTNNSKNSQLVTLKNQAWLDRQRIAGKCVSDVLSSVELLLKENRNISLKDIEAFAGDIINKHSCIPTFEGYRGFPGKICVSVNEQLVHGIPTDYVLDDGDIVKVDLGATYDGAIADAAKTYIYGTPKSSEHTRLVQVCEKALYAGIEAIKIGKKIGVIGYAIHNAVKDSGFGLIVNYGGHGLDTNQPHAAPFISNKSRPDDGIRIASGLTIAIEPMLCVGEPKTKEGSDGWTVSVPGMAAHFEHTIFVADGGVEIITK